VTDVDYVQVSRKAHELQNAHGQGAHKYAAKMAAQALADALVDEHKFWQAVEAALKPR
jgi:hypothetical protein